MGARLKLAKHLFTSESVTEGHPDKVADQISDAILDNIIARDPMARVACETLVTTGLVLISGEITCKCYVDIPHTVRETVREIGYTRAKYGFDCDTCAVLTSIDEQSPDISIGVDQALEIREGQALDDLFDRVGAGDQGLMVGYATDETPDLMPMPISLAHRLARRLAVMRKDGTLPYLRPDGKTQVTVEYENGRPVKIDTVVISAQHHPAMDLGDIRADLIEKVVQPIVPADLIAKSTRYLINPTGRFVIGGPQADTGLTGRKIIVDTYGSLARHGGGCFSGKDPTKVDRSSAYAARYVAKNIIAAGLASRCEVHVAYAIGVARPVALRVDTFGTSRIDERRLEKLVWEHFDLRPAAIIHHLDLRQPIYKQVAAYGHFGRGDLDLPWERTDKAVLLKVR
jgi:S-adenosylmethionine synthetase